jgi:COP9 signalosome complex subunit 7
LTKSATSPRAAIDLITRATSAPNTFVFTELLLSPRIQALTGTADAAYLTILEIFCYGTYESYRSTAGLPPLNDAQTLKLRQLSLVSLAQDPANLTYKRLISALELNSAVALEDLVITAIYGGLVSGTLDPKNQRVCISSTSPLRDVSPTSIPSLISTLHDWSGRCNSTLASLEQQIASIKSEAARRHKDELDWDAKLDKLIEGTANTGKDTRVTRNKPGEGAVKRGFVAAAQDADDGDMDLDSDEDESDDRKGGAGLKKKRGLGNIRLGGFR